MQWSKGQRGGEPRNQQTDGSTVSSIRTSVYARAKQEAAARTAVIEAEAEAQHAIARLAATRAECHEHQMITAEIETVQKSVQEELQASDCDLPSLRRLPPCGSHGASHWQD